LLGTESFRTQEYACSASRTSPVASSRYGARATQASGIEELLELVAVIDLEYE
jgi:hypothetical protein